MQRAISTHLLVRHRLNTIWLDRIWNSGIPMVEFFCARQHLDYHSKSQLGELTSWFGDAEMKLHSVHAPIFNDDCSGRSGPSAVIDISEVSKPKRIMHVDEVKRSIEIAERIPFRYLVLHLGVAGQQYDDGRVEAAFNSVEELSLFAAHRGVQVLLENIPSGIASAERLVYFVNTMHLDVNFCFDLGHANLMEGVDHAFSLMGPRIRSTHIHDNDGVDDRHLAPTSGRGGTVDWPATMQLLRSRQDQYPLLLELKDPGDSANPLEGVRQIFEKLESL